MSSRSARRAGRTSPLVVVVTSWCALVGACSSAPTPPPQPPVTVTVTPTSPSPTTTTESPSEVFERVRSGVVRVQSAGCPVVGSGTGFFVASDMVVTAAHVIREAFAISVRSDDGTGRATLVGVDWDRDVALLRVEDPSVGPPVRGTPFSWASKQPEVADAVVVLGYPKGQPLARTSGEISAVDQTRDVASQTRSGLIQYDAPTAGGNSGGPVLDPQGNVIGIVDAGDATSNSYNFAIPATAITGLIDSWTASPQVTVPDPSCDKSTYGIVDIRSVHPEARALALAIDGLLSGINNADSGAASTWVTANSSLSEWDDIHYSNIVLERANLKDRTSDTADVSYDAVPVDPGDTRGCLHHEVEFTMSIDNGFWQIASERDLSAPVACAGTSTPAPTDPSAPTFPSTLDGGLG